MNKTVIVTGGARGIGKAITTLLCSEGYNVILNYNSSKAEAEALADDLTKSGYNIDIFKADVSKSNEVDSLLEYTIKKYNKLDALVSNAGIAEQKLVTEITDNDWDKMISTNLSGCFYCNRAAAQLMVKQHCGSIVNISSMWGIVGASMESHYAASKAGVIALTKSLAKELGPSNIRVNCVAPGVIKTDMLNSFTDNDISALSRETPLLRIGEPENVADAVSFLLSNKAEFITGQVLSVDGGFIL